MNLNAKLCFLALILLAISCKKDDPVDASVVGTWKMTDIHTDNGVSESSFNGIAFTSNYNFHGTDYNTTTTFTENPNEFTSTGDYTFSITTIVSGSSSTQSVTVPAYTGIGQWSIEGDTLTQVFGGNTTKFEILELSGSKLRLKDDLNVTLNENGTIVHDQATIFTTFEKQ